MALPARRSIPCRSRATCVANRSSPMSWTESPSRARERGPAVPVVLGQAVLERDDRIALDPAGQQVDHARGVELLAALRCPVGRSSRAGSKKWLEATSTAIATSRPGSKPQATIASTTISNACSLSRSRGPYPPSSPTRADSKPRSLQHRARRRDRVRPSSPGLRCSWPRRPGRSRRPGCRGCRRHAGRPRSC